MTRNAITSSRLAKPVGPFAHAVRSGQQIFLSGQVGEDPKTGKLVSGGIIAQTRQLLDNVALLLDELGLSLAHVQKTTIFLVDIADFAAVNEVYAARFTKPYPARTTVSVQALPMSAAVEMDFIALGGAPQELSKFVPSVGLP